MTFQPIPINQGVGNTSEEKTLKAIAKLQNQVEVAQRVQVSPRYTSCNEGRLSLLAADPENVDGATTLQQTLYFLPYLGNKVDLLDDKDNPGNTHAWRVCVIPETGVQGDLSVLDADTVYDVFLYWDITTWNVYNGIVMEFVEWTDDTTRAQAITRIDGVLGYSPASSATRRYVGTIKTGTDEEEEVGVYDHLAARTLWNYQNQVPKPMSVNDQNNHTYTTATWRYWNDNSDNKLEFVLGLNRVIQPYCIFETEVNTATIRTCLGIGLDMVTPSSGNMNYVQLLSSGATIIDSSGCKFYGSNLLGYHYVTAAQRGYSGLTFRDANLYMEHMC